VGGVMYSYSEQSEKNLSSCDGQLIKLFSEVIRYIDNTITEGHRGMKAQNMYYNMEPQRSKVEYPNSKHNKIPSRAVDAVPYPIDYKDRERMREFRGIVYGIAFTMGIKLRKTIEWDLPHFELV
jgi:hypothetical protein